MLGVVAHAFNPSTWEEEASRFLVYSLVYKVSSREKNFFVDFPKSFIYFLGTSIQN